MTLAIFDLDNTLLAGDSDHAWGQFLVENGIVDGKLYRQANDRFYEDYQQGRLDISEYLAFALHPLTQHPRQQLLDWRRQFVEQMIRPILLPAAVSLVDKHRAQGHELLIITATNRFVTEPIAALFGIPHLIATDPEEVEGKYTGRVAGIPSFREGKVSRLDHWLAARGESFRDAYFYSDSHNDIPLLEKVRWPFAVDPDPQLAALATSRGWPILSLRAPA